MIARDIRNFQENVFQKDNYKFNIIGCDFQKEIIQIRNIHNKDTNGYKTTIESFFEIEDYFMKKIIIHSLKNLGKKWFVFDESENDSFGFIKR